MWGQCWCRIGKVSTATSDNMLETLTPNWLKISITRSLVLCFLHCKVTTKQGFLQQEVLGELGQLKLQIVVALIEH